MSEYSIRDLEHLSGIKAHTLRIWEQRYNIIQPKRTETNIRYYTDTDLKLVLNISLLKEHGFKISEIAKMTLSDLLQEVTSLTQKHLRYPDQIQSLTLAMIDLDEERFDKVMATNILQFGFENTMIHIIYPFLTKIGLLWQTGAITPAQEHFISNLIRQKLIVAIDGQIVRRESKSSTFLLYLPEGELHEISLLFGSYLLRARQYKVIYLGQSLPFADLCSVYEVHQPEYIFTIITSVPAQDEVEVYINKLATTFPDATIIVTGFQVIYQTITVHKNVVIIRHIDELIALVEKKNVELA